MSEQKVRGVKAGTKREPYKTRKTRLKTPRIGTTEWQFWRLQVGETYSVTRYLPMDEANKEKLHKLKLSMRASMTNHFNYLRKEEFKRDFSIAVYDFFDKNRKAFVVVSVVTAIQWFQIERVKTNTKYKAELNEL